MSVFAALRRNIWTDFHEISLQWCHNGRNGVSNYRPLDCVLNRLLMRRPKKTLKLRFTGLCGGNSQVTGEIPAQKASNAENVSIWWRHHVSVVYSRDSNNGYANSREIWKAYSCHDVFMISAKFHTRCCFAIHNVSFVTNFPISMQSPQVTTGLGICKLI